MYLAENVGPLKTFNSLLEKLLTLKIAIEN